MRPRLTALLLLLASTLALQACCGRDPDRPPAVEENGQRFLLCGQIVEDQEAEEITVGETRLKRAGFVVERVGETDGQARFGVISGVEEWNEPNRSNLDDLEGWFAEQDVDAIIVTGGIGANRETCQQVIEHLAKTKRPVLSLIGASADFAGYRRAVAKVRQSHKNVIDLTTARLVRWDGVDLISLPGYGNPFYLGHRRGGCAYQDGDVEALEALVDEARQPVLFVAAGPPRGRAEAAVDRARGGVNIGDPRLSRFIAKRQVAYGAFGHVYEAGGHASSDVEGHRPVAPGAWSKTLYLNPGAVEAVPYDLIGGGRSRGMGAVIEIGPQGARYHLRLLERLGEQAPAADAGPAAEAGPTVEAEPAGDAGLPLDAGSGDGEADR